jgi:hypothetical protein
MAAASLWVLMRRVQEARETRCRRGSPIKWIGIERVERMEDKEVLRKSTRQKRRHPAASHSCALIFGAETSSTRNNQRSELRALSHAHPWAPHPLRESSSLIRCLFDPALTTALILLCQSCLTHAFTNEPFHCVLEPSLQFSVLF